VGQRCAVYALQADHIDVEEMGDIFGREGLRVADIKGSPD